MKRVYFIISLVGILSLSVVGALFLTSEHMVHHRNGFVRQFPPHTIIPGDSLDIGFSSFYIAGGSRATLYLGNTTSPLRLLEIDLKTGRKSPRLINLGEYEKIEVRSPRIKMDSPFFYFADGTVPIVLQGNTSDWTCTQSVFGKGYFVDFEAISKNSIAMRSLSAVNDEYELAKETTSSIQLYPELLQRQIDGRFCVDGMLLSDKASARLAYVYYYRNEFIVADTNLNLLYRGNTIDTVSKADIKVERVSSIRMNSHAVPPLFVNKYSCISRDLLFVNSALLSKNENRNAFSNSAVVDIYDLQNRSYEFSFYISDYEGKRMHDFAIYDDLMVVLVDRLVMLYYLEPTYFRNSLFKKALHANQEKTEHL